MPIYHRLGKIPPKRHIQFRKENGELYYEELYCTAGFSGMYTNMYHINRPTMIKSYGKRMNVAPTILDANNVKPFLLSGFQVPPSSDFIESRKIVFANSKTYVILSAPAFKEMDYFYKNTEADELIFIHKGTGKLRTFLGNIDFVEGDYLIIPRGTIFTLEFNTSEGNRLFIVESRDPFESPARYRNYYGQMLEHSPFCERDYKLPKELESHDERGEFLMKTKKNDEIIEVVFDAHPFDVVGYDGYNYPYAMNIKDFEPITGRLHMPPTIHQHFQTESSVICSFVPRLFDYHPLSIPAPYNHSNIDSDELLYYVDGEFMSRPFIKPGNITLHPAGFTHGPQPGAAEASIGKKGTEEYAVMVDTFAPLGVTEEALKISDPDYFKTWLDK
ncbi:MAG: homogentisate 1,2-dioxygenase [Bacteroidia bacterium]|nr:homogentisate 1,2-dioxygenase [Bacteroidia bacterium]